MKQTLFVIFLIIVIVLSLFGLTTIASAKDNPPGCKNDSPQIHNPNCHDDPTKTPRPTQVQPTSTHPAPTKTAKPKPTDKPPVIPTYHNPTKTAMPSPTATSSPVPVAMASITPNAITGEFVSESLLPISIPSCIPSTSQTPILLWILLALSIIALLLYAYHLTK